MQYNTYIQNDDVHVFGVLLFSRVHALSVCRSVRPSVTLCFFLAHTGNFGVTAPVQQLSWSISSQPLPTRTRLVSRYGLVQVLIDSVDRPYFLSLPI